MCKIIVITGGTCSGKTTLIKKVVGKSPNKIKKSKTCTSRTIREEIENNNDYYFFSDKEFEEKIANNEFIEYYKTNNNIYYGLLKSEIDLKSDYIYLIAMNESGLDNLRKYLSDKINLSNLYHIHIYSKANIRLERILNTRCVNNDEDIYEYCNRMYSGKEEEETLRKEADFVLNNNYPYEKEKNEIFLEVFCRSILK